MSTNPPRVFKPFLALAVALGIGVGIASTAGVLHARADSNAAAGHFMAPMNESSVAPLLALDSAMEAVADRVTPSVVNIVVVSRVAGAQMNLPPGMSPDQGGAIPGLPPGMQGWFGQFFGNGNGVPAPPQVQKGLGSGVIISPDGYIVTNNHVVDGATQMTVTLNDKRAFSAKLIGVDKATDLAVVKIDASGLPAAAWGDSGQLKAGQTVLAFGDPLGMDFSVTRGIVSALNRSRQRSDGPDARGSFIQTDAAINPGNSGGPLVDARGEVIGIDTEMLTESGGSSGIGFAIPSNVVRPAMDALIKNGKVVRGYLGVLADDVTPALAQSLDTAPTGALVDSVTPGSPADKAGVRTYDVVTSVNGEKVSGSGDLQNDIGAVAPGTAVRLGIVRDGKPETLSATLGNLDAAGGSAAAVERDAGNGSTSSAPQLGVKAATLTPALRGQFQLSDSVQGVAITQVDPGSPADLAGLSSGDVIEQVNRHAVSTPDELRTQLAQTAAGRPALLLVLHNGSTHIAAVQPTQ